MSYNKQQTTLLFHDYESSGLDKSYDRPMQFAAIRTDMDLNIIGEPVTWYCKLPDDVVPDPTACLLTGVTPQVAEQNGVCEAEFAKKIMKLMSVPGTCSLGYNTIKFDDELTRNMLYRNLMPPYEREFKNGNSRWDILPLVRAVFAFNPSALNWPQDEEGNFNLRLENLADVNNLPKTRAHDALSDVETTIALAKLIKERSPEIFHYAFNCRLKNNVVSHFDMVKNMPFFHVSPSYGFENGLVAPVVVGASHPTQTNSFALLNLREDPEIILQLSPQEIAERIYTREKELKIPVSIVATNKSEVFMSIQDTKDFGVEKIGIGFSREVANANYKKFKQHRDEIHRKLTAAMGLMSLEPVSLDPERGLYSGFPSRSDEAEMARLSRMAPESLVPTSSMFSNPKYTTMFNRYKARNWPEMLPQQDYEKWMESVKENLETGGPMKGRTIHDFAMIMSNMNESGNFKDNQLFKQLEEWYDKKVEEFRLVVNKDSALKPPSI